MKHGERINYRLHINEPSIAQFLQMDTAQPDTVSLQLMMSGDVERNPGHITGPAAEVGICRNGGMCKGCSKIFSAIFNPVECLRMHKGFSTILRIFFYKNKNTQKTYIKPYIIRKLNKFSFH